MRHDEPVHAGGPDPVPVLQQVLGTGIALGQPIRAGAAERQLLVPRRQFDGARSAAQHRASHADVVVLVLPGDDPGAVHVPPRADEIGQVLVADSLAEPLFPRLDPLAAQAERSGRPVEFQAEALPAPLHVHGLEVIVAVGCLAAQAVEPFWEVAVGVGHPHPQRPERRVLADERAEDRGGHPAGIGGSEVVFGARGELRLLELADVAVGVEHPGFVRQPAAQHASAHRDALVARRRQLRGRARPVDEVEFGSPQVLLEPERDLEAAPAHREPVEGVPVDVDVLPVLPLAVAVELALDLEVEVPGEFALEADAHHVQVERVLVDVGVEAAPVEHQPAAEAHVEVLAEDDRRPPVLPAEAARRGGRCGSRVLRECRRGGTEQRDEQHEGESSHRRHTGSPGRRCARAPARALNS